MKRVWVTFLLTLLMGCTAHQPRDHKPMLGLWMNQTNGDKVGLTLINNESCELLLDRFLCNATKRHCKYEAYNNYYLIFLVKDNGSCGNTPDFKFIYEPQQPLIELIIGSSNILLQKMP